MKFLDHENLEPYGKDQEATQTLKMLLAKKWLTYW